MFQFEIYALNFALMGVQAVFINGPFSFILVVFLNPHKRMFNRLRPHYTLIGNFLPQWTMLNNTIWCEHEHEQMRSPNMFPCQSLINAICFRMCHFTLVRLFEIGCHYKVFFFFRYLILNTFTFLLVWEVPIAYAYVKPFIHYC